MSVQISMMGTESKYIKKLKKQHLTNTLYAELFWMKYMINISAAGRIFVEETIYQQFLDR